MPTVLFVVDDTFDTSIVVSISEEEQEKDGENNIDIEFFISENTQNVTDTVVQLPVKNLIYCNKTYSTPLFNIISPPPDNRYS